VSDREPGQRIKWLDICKGILVLFVLLSHSRAPTMYSRFFSGFFLTMFFFVSGYTFSTKQSFKLFIINKAKRLLVPFLAMGSIKLLVACVFQNENFLDRIKGLLFQISGYNDDLWFIGCLLSSSLIFYCIVKISEHTNKRFLVPVLSIIISLIGWVLIIAFKAKLPWQAENACIMTLYMMLGYQYKRLDKKIIDFIESKFTVGVCATIYCLFAILLENDVNIHRGIYSMYTPHIIMTLLSIPVLIVLSKKIEKFCVGGGNLLQYIGKNSLFLYAFENYVIKPFFKICDLLTLRNEYVLPILCVFVIVIGLSPFIWIVNRYLPWMVGGKKS